MGAGLTVDAGLIEQLFRVVTLRAGYNSAVVLIGTTLLGVASGLVGSFLLLRRRSLTADAVSHATLPGVAGAFLISAMLGGGKSLAVLLFGAAVTALLGVLSIAWVLRHTRLREDAAIGIVLSVFFGAGVVLLSVVQNIGTGNAGGLSHFIYGQAAAMSRGDAVFMGTIALVAACFVLIVMKEMSLVAFNESFARVIGLRVSLLDGALLGLVIAVTVAGIQAVGLILAVAMLIIPPAAARFWTDRLFVFVALSGLIGGASAYLGVGISALSHDFPTGSVIVLTAGGIFALSLCLSPRRGVIAESVRRVRQRLTLLCDHVLEWVYTEGSGGAARRGEVIERFGRLPIWLLRLGGRVRIERERVMLTERGRAEGARIARNHRLWEQYLVTYADVAPTHVDWSVDQIEHVLSEELVAELENALASAGAKPKDGGA